MTLTNRCACVRNEHPERLAEIELDSVIQAPEIWATRLPVSLFICVGLAAARILKYIYRFSRLSAPLM